MNESKGQEGGAQARAAVPTTRAPGIRTVPGVGEPLVRLVDIKDVKAKRPQKEAAEKPGLN